MFAVIIDKKKKERNTYLPLNVERLWIILLISGNNNFVAVDLLIRQNNQTGSPNIKPYIIL